MWRMLCLLESIRPNPRLVDIWVWELNSKGIFSSKSLYLELFCDRLVVVPYKIIWFQGIPSKVAFFLWTSFLDKILTLDHLQSRG